MLHSFCVALSPYLTLFIFRYFFQFHVFFVLHYFLCCTFLMLHSFHIVLFPCCSLFMFCYFHVALFCCTCFSYCILFMFHSFHAALFPCCTIFMLFFCVALFLCCIFYVLLSFHLALWCVNIFQNRFLAENFGAIASFSSAMLFRNSSVIKQKDESQNECFKNVSVSGGKKYSFFGKFGVLCFLETPVLRFALLPYYKRILLNHLPPYSPNCYFFKHPGGVFLFCKHDIVRKESKFWSNAIDALLLESKLMTKIFQRFLKFLLTDTSYFQHTPMTPMLFIW